MNKFWDTLLNMLAGMGIMAILAFVYGVVQLKEDRTEAKIKQPIKQVVVKK